MTDPGDSLRTRPLRFVDGTIDPADLAEAVRLVVGCEAAVLDTPDTSPIDVAGMLADPFLDRDASCFLLRGDEVVGGVWITKDSFEGVTGIDTFSLPWPGSEPVPVP